VSFVPSLSFFSVEARFLPASRLWSFVPPGKFGGGCFPLASRGYGGLFLCWFFSSFLLSGSKAKSMVPSAGIWWHSCLLAVVFGLFFFKGYFNFFGARSTQHCCFSQDMRRSALFSVAVRSRCRKHVSRRSSVTGAWPARAREAFALWCA
jgi:hypothetical protein